MDTSSGPQTQRDLLDRHFEEDGLDRCRNHWLSWMIHDGHGKPAKQMGVSPAGYICPKEGGHWPEEGLSGSQCTHYPPPKTLWLCNPEGPLAKEDDRHLRWLAVLGTDAPPKHWTPSMNALKIGRLLRIGVNTPPNPVWQRLDWSSNRQASGQQTAATLPTWPDSWQHRSYLSQGVILSQSTGSQERRSFRKGRLLPKPSLLPVLLRSNQWVENAILRCFRLVLKAWRDFSEAVRTFSRLPFVPLHSKEFLEQLRSDIERSTVERRRSETWEVVQGFLLRLCGVDARWGWWNRGQSPGPGGREEPWARGGWWWTTGIDWCARHCRRVWACAQWSGTGDSDWYRSAQNQSTVSLVPLRLIQEHPAWTAVPPRPRPICLARHPKNCPGGSPRSRYGVWPLPLTRLRWPSSPPPPGRAASLPCTRKNSLPGGPGKGPCRCWRHSGRSLSIDLLHVDPRRVHVCRQRQAQAKTGSLQIQIQILSFKARSGSCGKRGMRSLCHHRQWGQTSDTQTMCSIVGVTHPQSRCRKDRRRVELLSTRTPSNMANSEFQPCSQGVCSPAGQSPTLWQSSASLKAMRHFLLSCFHSQPQNL